MEERSTSIFCQSVNYDPVFSSMMKRFQILCHDVTMFHPRSWRSPDVEGLNAPNWAAGGGCGLLLPSQLIKSLIHSLWLHPRNPETGRLSWNLLICLWFWAADLFSHEPTWKPAEPASKISLCAAMAKTGFLEIWIFTQRPECKQRNVSFILWPSSEGTKSSSCIGPREGSKYTFLNFGTLSFVGTEKEEILL